MVPSRKIEKYKKGGGKRRWNSRERVLLQM